MDFSGCGLQPWSAWTSVSVACRPWSAWASVAAACSPGARGLQWLQLAAMERVDFSGCRLQAWRAWTSVAAAQELSFPTACAIFPDQGPNPCPLHWQADSYPTVTTREVSEGFSCMRLVCPSHCFGTSESAYCYFMGLHSLAK